MLTNSPSRDLTRIWQAPLGSRPDIRDRILQKPFHWRDSLHSYHRSSQIFHLGILLEAIYAINSPSRLYSRRYHHCMGNRCGKLATLFVLRALLTDILFRSWSPFFNASQSPIFLNQTLRKEIALSMTMPSSLESPCRTFSQMRRLCHCLCHISGSFIGLGRRRSH